MKFISITYMMNLDIWARICKQYPQNIVTLIQINRQFYNRLHRILIEYVRENLCISYHINNYHCNCIPINYKDITTNMCDYYIRGVPFPAICHYYLSMSMNKIEYLTLDGRTYLAYRFKIGNRYVTIVKSPIGYVWEYSNDKSIYKICARFIEVFFPALVSILPPNDVFCV